MSAGVTEVGARLSLLNSPAFIRNAEAAAAAVDKLTASIDAASAAAEKQVAANAAIADSNARVAASASVSSKASTDATLAADAAILKSSKAKAAASDAATVATKSQNTALNTMAKNPVLKSGALTGAALVAWAYEGIKWTATFAVEPNPSAYTGRDDYRGDEQSPRRGHDESVWRDT
jgi:hypothetical protein